MEYLWWVLLFVLVGFAVDIWFIKTEYDGQKKKATYLKGAASFLFVCLGFYCFLQHQTGSAWLILIGLVLGMIGDILLNLRCLYEGATKNKIFAVGIASFLTGHFLYIAFLTQGNGVNWLLGLGVTAVLSVVSIPLILRKITAPSKGIKIFGCVYLVVVNAMFSFALARLITFGDGSITILFTVGAFSFVVSDFIMIYFTFGKQIKPLRAINLLAYYLGQVLIAMCILFI